MARRGKARPGKARQGGFLVPQKLDSYSWQGRAWLGMARQGKARQGVWQNYKLPIIIKWITMILHHVGNAERQTKNKYADITIAIAVEIGICL